MDDQIEHHMSENHVGDYRGFKPAILHNHSAMHEQGQHKIQNNVRQPLHHFNQQPHDFHNPRNGHPDRHEGSYLESKPSFTETPGTRGGLPTQAPWHQFKFSAPSFNVDARVSNPSASLNPHVSSEQPSGSRTKIFDIDFAVIAKPSKQSKAIPIDRPYEAESAKEEHEQATMDDAETRLVPTHRHKRAEGEAEQTDQDTAPVYDMAQQTPQLSEADEIGAGSFMPQIDGLKSMLRLAEERAETEYRLRCKATDSVGELQQLLKVAEEDLARHSAAAEDAEARLLQFKEETIPHLEKMQFRSESLAEESETLKVTIAELLTKNIALEGTLDEHLVSADSFRRQLETTKAENSSLHETVDALRTHIEDSMAARQKMAEKFDRLQIDMVNVTADVACEQGSWRRKDEEQAAKFNELLGSFNQEAKLRKKLQEEVAVCDKQKEPAKVKFLYEQSQQENVKIEETIAVLRAENHNLQLTVARFERELNEARETSRMGIQRRRRSVEADLKAQILRLETQPDNVDNVRLDGDTSRERLALAKNWTKHLEKRVQHLEEKLEIAQSAARAAAEAAQTAKAAPSRIPGLTTTVPTHSTLPSMSFSKGFHEPERISLQALRESIFVLQDQLQQRETRIEELEQEIECLDKDAPNKIKERDSEINWLRELLGVRIDDLQDIIKTLSQPSFNQHAVRDAAIRLRANLQMQQQERELAQTGSGLSSLQSLTKLAASPRSLSLAAAAAWGSWRKARESANGGSTPSEQTQSKSSNAGAFLSGLLTLPSSHARQTTPNRSGPERACTKTHPLRGFSSTPRRGSIRQEVTIAEPPKTPSLLRRSSYDHDAEPANYEEGDFASPMDADEGPFSPSTSAEAIAKE